MANGVTKNGLPENNGKYFKKYYAWNYPGSLYRINVRKDAQGDKHR